MTSSSDTINLNIKLDPDVKTINLVLKFDPLDPKDPEIKTPVSSSSNPTEKSDAEIESIKLTKLPDQIYQHYDLPAKADQNFNLLCKIVELGDVELLKVLRHVFKLTIEEVIDQDHDQDDIILSLAVLYQQDQILQVLHDHYGLTASHIRKANLLIIAAKCGHIKILEVFHEIYGLTTQDARAQENEALRWAVIYGDFKVVKILHSVYGLTDEDLRQSDVLPKLIRDEKNDMLEALSAIFSLTPDDLQDLKGPKNLKDPEQIESNPLIRRHQEINRMIKCKCCSRYLFKF